MISNPGSIDANKQGCTCPVMDNNYGRGGDGAGAGRFWITRGCPLHDLPREDASFEEPDEWHYVAWQYHVLGIEGYTPFGNDGDEGGTYVP